MTILQAAITLWRLVATDEEADHRRSITNRQCRDAARMFVALQQHTACSVGYFASKMSLSRWIEAGGVRAKIGPLVQPQSPRAYFRG
jgi:hypothetical protein